MNYQRYKTILENLKGQPNTLKEQQNSSYTDPDAGSGFTGGTYAPFKVEDPEVFSHINTFLKNFGLERHSDPKHSLVMLRTKLNTIGLDFSYDGRRPLSPKEVFHLTQFGGRTGVDEKGNKIDDCGISHRNGGKGIELHVEINPIDIQGDQKGPYYMNIKMEHVDAMARDVQLEPEASAALISLKKK
jgi:hypothetical protein